MRPSAVQMRPRDTPDGSPGWAWYDLALVGGAASLLVTAGSVDAYGWPPLAWWNGLLSHALWSLLCMAILVLALRRGISRATLGLVWPRSWMPVALIVGGAVLACFLLVLLSVFLLIAALAISEPVRTVLGSEAGASGLPDVPRPAFSPAFLAIGIVTREFVYRGFLLSALVSRLRTSYASLIIAALEALIALAAVTGAFAGSSVPLLLVVPVTVMFGSGIFILSILLAWGRLHSGSLLVPIAARGVMVGAGTALLALT